MSDMKDTLLRQLALLRLIPESPRYTSTAILHEKLQERGFAVNLRSVQRDLVRLSVMFPLISEEKGGRNAWCFSEGASLDLRDMESPTALALTLAEDHLQSLLPQTVLSLMAPQFRKARAYLDSMEKNQLSNWSRRVRAVPNGKSLLPAQIDAEVWTSISLALLEHKQLAVSYLARGKTQASEFILHPAGIVSRHATSYLIASVNDYNDLRQFALHRIRTAQVLDKTAKPHKHFNVDNYIREELNTGSTIKPVLLVAEIAPNIAWLLNETPLAEQQSILPLENSDWFRLEVTVPDDTETLWWVFGLGEHVCVQQPQHWREKIAQKLSDMQQLYGGAGSHSKSQSDELNLMENSHEQ